MIKANIVLLLAFVIGNQSMKAQNFQWLKAWEELILMRGML
jgi:hypothetical protein